jgi:hypothetical protein
MADWQTQRHERQIRLEANRYASGKLVSPENTKALLEAVIPPAIVSASKATIRSKLIFLPRLCRAHPRLPARPRADGVGLR